MILLFAVEDALGACPAPFVIVALPCRSSRAERLLDSFSREQVMNDATYFQEAWPRLESDGKAEDRGVHHEENRDRQGRGRDRPLLPSLF
jgi:hypothetical protein